MLVLVETKRLPEQLRGIQNAGSPSVSLTANQISAIPKAVIDSAAGRVVEGHLTQREERC